jgi:methylated-DNA-[protein]-cysteine S-methyltransferase
MSSMRYRIIDTPTGPFAVFVGDDGSLGTGWVRDERDPLLHGGRADDSLEPELTARLKRYFRGEAVDFDGVPLPAGGGFGARCWRVCRTIPRGETRTYAQLAVMAGSTPGAARAVGQAMRRNPLPVVVPCHRVLAAGGRLGGFGGQTDPRTTALRTKRWLLEMEGTGAACGAAAITHGTTEVVCG